MRAAAPTLLSAYVMRLSWPVPRACRLAQIWGTLGQTWGVGGRARRVGALSRDATHEPAGRMLTATRSRPQEQRQTVGPNPGQAAAPPGQDEDGVVGVIQRGDVRRIQLARQRNPARGSQHGHQQQRAPQAAALVVVDQQQQDVVLDQQRLRDGWGWGRGWGIAEQRADQGLEVLHSIRQEPHNPPHIAKSPSTRHSPPSRQRRRRAGP